jgi:membrane protein implicated in regulation of membrane protease activity
MATYTFHPPAEAWRDPRALERAELVRDGFVWGAFLFTFLWFFAHRLWLAGFLVLAGVLALMIGLPLLGLSPGAASLAGLLVSGLIGLEASSLRRWTLARRGRPAADVVSGASFEEAEAKALARYLAGRREEARGERRTEPRPPGRSPALSESPAIGLFPESEARR